MRKFIYMTPLAIVAALGIGINLAYYRTSFLFSGYGEAYAVSLGIAFMALEVVLWLYADKKWFITILKIAIVFYSISVTLGAQFFSSSLSETQSRKAINNTAGLNDEIEDYRQQISELNTQIMQYIEQQRIFGSERNREDRTRAEAKRNELQLKLDNARELMRSEIAIIEPPKTAYDWYAEQTGISPDSVRMSFQLFASILLALMAPISLTMIRGYKAPEIIKPEPIPEIKPEPELKPFKTPFEEMALVDKSNILKMLLWNFPDSKINNPKYCSEMFADIHNTKPTVKAYTINDCKIVYDEIFKRELEKLSKDGIKEELFK